MPDGMSEYVRKKGLIEYDMIRKCQNMCEIPYKFVDIIEGSISKKVSFLDFFGKYRFPHEIMYSFYMDI